MKNSEVSVIKCKVSKVAALPKVLDTITFSQSGERGQILPLMVVVEKQYYYEVLKTSTENPATTRKCIIMIFLVKKKVDMKYLCQLIHS